MKTVCRRIISIFVGLLALFAASFSCLLRSRSVASYAASSVGFDQTDVLDDLKSMDGFSLEKFPYYESAKPEMKVIDLVEYCYDYRPIMRENYGLYLYVYNPNKQDIITMTAKNKVQIAVAYDSDPITEKSIALTYEKFDLEFCSVSSGSGVDKLFYKFKVVDHKSADGKTIAERVNSADRRYDISGIELQTRGDSNATEYSVSTSYRFSGFAEGYGNDDGVLTPLTRNTLETVSLELHSTTYRFPYINQNGPGHQNQLDSVYFAVPKEFNENFGDLYRVKCCWDEQKTSPVIVTNRQEVYEDVAAHLGTDGSGAKYGVFDNFTVQDLMGGAGSLRCADWAFNKDVGGKSFPVMAPDTPYVGYVFKSDKDSVKDTDITSAQMKEWISSHGNANYLFSESVDEGRTKGYQEHTFTADEPFDMLTFNQTASGWDKFRLNWQAFWTGKSWDFGDGAETTVEPIRLIKDGDFTGADATDAGKLYVHTDDFDEFESFYNANKSTKNVFLLRFAVTDYYSNMADVRDGGFFSSVDDESTYIARETVFLDFDIIELTFLRDTTETIIPVVASPIDVVGGISAPIVEDGIAWGKLIVAILALILVLVLLAPVLPYIIRAVLWVIALPFKAIAALVKAIKNAAKKRRNKRE